MNMRRPDFPPQESAFSTEFGNKVVENRELSTPDISELHKNALLEIAAAFKSAGIRDWAIAGSMQKIFAGVQEAKDTPGDIDIVTTKPGVEALWKAVQSGELSFGGNATFHEPKEYDADVKYGKSTVLAIDIQDPLLGILEIEIFGEGDGEGGTYGGSVQLGNENRHAEIWKLEGDIQILSEKDQRRQYVLVLCNELSGEAGGKKEKISSRLISLLQYAENHPEDIKEDIAVLSSEYSYLPDRLTKMVQNMGSLLNIYPFFRELAEKRLGGVPTTESLKETDVLNIVSRIEELKLDNSPVVSEEMLTGITEYVSRIDYNAIQDKKTLRRVFDAIYKLAQYVHAHFPDSVYTSKAGIAKRDISKEKKALARALDAVSLRSGQYRGWHAEFMRVKVESLEF